jgi:hypothetical protein
MLRSWGGADPALAGVNVVVLERLPGRTGLSKALNLQPRTPEVLDLRGLLGRAEQRSFATVADGHFAVSYAGWDTRHPYQWAPRRRRSKRRWRSGWASRV